MSDQTWYYKDSAGAQQGPISTQQLQSLIAKAEITEDSLVKTESQGETWLPAATHHDLFSVSLQTPDNPTLRDSSQVAVTPIPAPTTPMLPSTPTTQPIRGVPVPKAHKSHTDQTTPYGPPSSNPEREPDTPPSTPSTTDSRAKLWTVLIIVVTIFLFLAIKLLLASS